MTEPGASFRDPAGVCCLVDGRVLRILSPDSAAVLEGFLQTSTAREFGARGQLVATRRLGAEQSDSVVAGEDGAGRRGAGVGRVVFEHERIWFPSFPYEWPAELLWEAGRLTLELATAALAEGYGLKDATPYNVLYRGSEPVFIDLASFERRQAGDPMWNPHGQFVRTFLLPLVAWQRWGLPLAAIFTTRRDGLEPQEVYRLCGSLERLSPRLLPLVSIPTWLRGKAAAEGDKLYQRQTLADTDKARFIVESLFRRLQRGLRALKPPAGKDSVWSDYMATHSYNEPAFAAKQKFVEGVLQEFKPGRVLDVGANTGHFSALAAQAGAEVVAIDSDPACVGAIWRRAQAERLNVLPLVVDISRPSPALGWRNQENASFLQRAAGAFDCVLMLAVIHHLLVTERVPLDEIIGLASDLTNALAVVEFVGPQDEMFRRLTRGREHLHTEVTEAAFEQACAPHFEVLRSLALPGRMRRIYALKRKGSCE